MAAIRWVVLICVLFHSELSLQDEQDDKAIFNGVADFILKTIKIFNQSKVQIKDVIDKKLAKGSVTFNGKKGSMSDFKTAKRFGEAHIDDSLMVTFKVKFDDLKIKFEEYSLSALMVKVDGQIELVAKDTSIEFGVDIKQDSKFLEIKKIEVKKVGKVELKFYDKEGKEVPVQGAISSAANLVQNPMKTEVADILKGELSRLITSTDQAAGTDACLGVSTDTKPATCVRGKFQFSDCATK